MVKIKSKGKKPIWSYFFFAESPFLHFYHQGAFCKRGRKKEIMHCLICHIFPLQCVFECIFCRGVFKFKLSLDLDSIFLIHRSVHLVFPFTSDQPWQLKTCHPLEVVFIIIICMYWQTNVCAPVNSEVQTRTCTHFCPLKTCDQPDPIPCNHLELPHAPTYCSASIPSNGLGQGLKQWASFP